MRQIKHSLDLKPLSANKMWLGAKRKSKEYRIYEKESLNRLPSGVVIPKQKIDIKIAVFYSSSRSDIDNALKPFLDILQKRYKFDDCRVYDMHTRKFICKKGEERIMFNIKSLPHNIYEENRLALINGGVWL